MTTPARIALIHAVTVAMEPIEAAFRRHWPEPERMNLLDDALSVDRAKDHDLTSAVQARIGALADYAVGAGAGAILYTCSAFGPAIEAVARRLACPVLKPNEAMFQAAFGHGRRIGMVATFEPAVAGMEEEFREAAAGAAVDARIETVCVPAAMAALRAGDTQTHNMLVAEAALTLAEADAIMLAHFSTSRALAAVAGATTRPVLTSPDAAVARLKALLGAAPQV